ncbi:MAG TPA: pentapeptide repeat-containing protein [Tepidisphaeraceae bacterium]|jgi:uncharacterized protein YjbI with pentapeptide repeats|nr:pentapeptide repeat-containing protein [Tepidisphaeraceae bacterium]
MHPSLPQFGADSGFAPRRPPVTPRVQTAPGGAALALEHHIRGLLRAGAVGVVCLHGSAGSGKTVAAEHIAQVFSGEGLVIRDINARHLADDPPEPQLTLLTSYGPPSGPVLVALEMAGWTDDDLIEYLAATHRQRVSAVMKRVTASPDREAFSGKPELWRMVLDVLAADDSHAGIWDALQWRLALEFPTLPRRSAGRMYCMAQVVRPVGVFELPFKTLGEFEVRERRLLVHRPVQLMLAAELVIDSLHDNPNPRVFSRKLPHDLLARAALLAHSRPKVHPALYEAVRTGAKPAQSTAASILHAMKIGWRPEMGHVPDLTSAHLDDANWPDVHLPSCEARCVSFRHANLTRARLEKGNFTDARFGSAKLCEANLDHISASRADFTAADLSGASAVSAVLSDCKLRNAKLERANLFGATLAASDLRDANARNAGLIRADFTGAQINGTDFSGANLGSAILNRQDLGTAHFSGASFHMAAMNHCNLEYMELPAPDFHEADLTGALLTGSIFPRANFRGAKLNKCGLADIEWEGADFRKADFSESSFHAGSTRSGLVGSAVPCEGSKTGFYTDDFGDRDFKPPEEIRKANLHGADLRGAKTAGVDFYLVDIRNARFSRAQAKWFRKCGAIM